jgi:hypothetical protein
MTTPTINSPLKFSLKNPGKADIPYYLPKRSLFMPMGDAHANPLITTESMSGILKGNSQVDLTIPTESVRSPSSGSSSTGPTKWYCQKCGVVCTYPFHICPCGGQPNCSHHEWTIIRGGSCVLTPFMRLGDSWSGIHPNVLPKEMLPKPPEPIEPTEPVEEPDKPEEKQPDIPPPINGCDIFRGSLRNVTVISVFPVRRPLKGLEFLAQEKLFDEKGVQDMSRAYHAGVILFFENGLAHVVEKDPTGIHGHSVDAKQNTDGAIYDNSGTKWHADSYGNTTPNRTAMGEDIMALIERINDVYSLVSSNCQHFVDAILDHCGVDPRGTPDEKAKQRMLLNAIEKDKSVSEQKAN